MDVNSLDMNYLKLARNKKVKKDIKKNMHFASNKKN